MINTWRSLAPICDGAPKHPMNRPHLFLPCPFATAKYFRAHSQGLCILGTAPSLSDPRSLPSKGRGVSRRNAATLPGTLSLFPISLPLPFEGRGRGIRKIYCTKHAQAPGTFSRVLKLLRQGVGLFPRQQDLHRIRIAKSNDVCLPHMGDGKGMGNQLGEVNFPFRE